MKDYIELLMVFAAIIFSYIIAGCVAVIVYDLYNFVFGG